MLDEVVLARVAAGDALAAAVLTAIGVDRQPFDVAVVAQRDRVLFLGDQIFQASSRPGPSSIICVVRSLPYLSRRCTRSARMRSRMFFSLASSSS